MNDPLVKQLINKYLEILIVKSMQVFQTIDVNKSPQEIIKMIQNQLIPEIKSSILQWKKDIQKQKQQLGTVLPVFQRINVVFSEDDIVQKVLDELDKLYNILGNRSIQHFIIKNIKLIIQNIFEYQCMLYEVMYPIVQTKNIIKSQFDNLFQVLVKNEQTYSDILQQVFGIHWKQYTKIDNAQIFQNQINFKNVVEKQQMQQIKVIEVQCAMKQYDKFYHQFNDTLMEIGKKITANKWFPQGPAEVLQTPAVISLLHDYIFQEDHQFSLINILLSKECMKFVAIAYKIFLMNQN